MEPLNDQNREAFLSRWPISLLLGWMIVGLLGGMLGVFAWWWVAPFGGALGWFLGRELPRDGVVVGRRTPWIVWAGLVVVIAGIFASAALWHSELVWTGRDGATYANTAKWLAEKGNLRPEVRIPPFDVEELDLSFDSPGFVDGSDGRLWIQFMHGIPAVLALFSELIGDVGIFAGIVVFAVFGVVGLFQLLRRHMEGGWALLAVSLLSVSLPFVYYSRSTFTEIPMLAFLAIGLYLIRDDSSVDSKFWAGVFLGATLLTRVDAWMVGLALASVGLWSSLVAKDRLDEWNKLMKGYMLVGLLGVVDLVVFSPFYVAIVGKRLAVLVSGFLVLRILGEILGRREIGHNSAERLVRIVSVGSWIIVAAFAAMVLAIRPWLVEGYGSTYDTVRLQELEGLAVDPARNYSEMAGIWPVWYLGWLVVLAGWATMASSVKHAIRERRLDAITVCAVVCATSLVYSLGPQANPDHIWVMRRFLPVVLPGLVGFGVYGTRAAVDRLSGRWRPISVSVVSVMMVLPAVYTTVPALRIRDGAGTGSMIMEMCEVIENRPVLFVETVRRSTSGFFGQPIRGWCGVPVAAITVGTSGEARDMADSLAGEGVVFISEFAELLPGERSLEMFWEVEFLQETLMKTPNESSTRTARLFFEFPS